MPRTSERPSSPRTRPREPVPRQTQEERRATSNLRLLESGLALIAQHGSVGMTLAEVGIAAGYSRGLASERFGTKLAFLEAIVDHLHDWLVERIQARIAGLKGLDAALARIECHLDAAIENPAFHRSLYHLVIESTWSERGLHRHITALEDDYRKGFVAHLREGQALGQVRADVDATRQAGLIIGTMRGLIIQALVADAPASLKTVKADFTAMVRNNLAAPAKTRARRRT